MTMTTGHTEHWADRNQSIGRDLAKFFSDHGNTFGATTAVTFAASALVSTLMTGDGTHPMVAENLRAIAGSVGLTGALASAPMFMGAAIANKLAERMETPPDNEQYGPAGMPAADGSQNIHEIPEVNRLDNADHDLPGLR